MKTGTDFLKRCAFVAFDALGTGVEGDDPDAASDPAGGRAKATNAREFVMKKQAETMAVVKKNLSP